MGLRGTFSTSNCSFHTDLVTDLDFSPFDDFLLASGSADRMVSGAGWKSCLGPMPLHPGVSEPWLLFMPSLAPSAYSELLL